MKTFKKKSEKVKTVLFLKSENSFDFKSENSFDLKNKKVKTFKKVKK